MKEPKLEVIHSAALNVTTNAQHQVFEKYSMWKVLGIRYSNGTTEFVDNTYQATKTTEGQKIQE